MEKETPIKITQHKLEALGKTYYYTTVTATAEGH